MRALLTSPELLEPEAFGAKTKTPFEFVVSAVRRTGAEVDAAMPLVRATAQLGMPLYMCQPPTGYEDTAEAWMNTGGLVGRLNFAVALATNRLPFVTTPERASAAGGRRSPAGSETLALELGSPQFQKR